MVTQSSRQVTSISNYYRLDIISLEYICTGKSAGYIAFQDIFCLEHIDAAKQTAKIVFYGDEFDIPMQIDKNVFRQTDEQTVVRAYVDWDTLRQTVIEQTYARTYLDCDTLRQTDREQGRLRYTEVIS